jgi:hypothetical protein
MQLLSALSPIANLQQLRRDKESSTFERLLVSRHVAELRLIFSFTLFIMVLVLVLCLAFPVYVAHDGLNDPFKALADSGVMIGAVWAIGCGLLAWAYQTGSARLGVVDLFACEIATLCRVTVVVDAVQHFVDLGKAVPSETSRFSSQESYFPVFDSTVKDLQQLEEKVVKDVTAFYTYMKVMRDYLRKLADINPEAPNAGERWRAAVGNVMYMLFLGLESARHSIDALVEFQPTWAEEKGTILLSEITAYGYLRQTVTDPLLSQRLQAREEEYRKVIHALDLAADQHSTDKGWKSAGTIIGELMRRYAQVFAPAPTRFKFEPAHA